MIKERRAGHSQVVNREDLLLAVTSAHRARLARVGRASTALEQLLADAIVHLWEATKHYEGRRTWDATCQGCAALRERCAAAEARAEQAEAALAVSLARRELDAATS